jgi:hypothetical protein
MPHLDDALRAAVASGRLTALTFWPTAEGWQVNARWKRGAAEGWNCVTCSDPVAGALEALSEKTDDAAPQEDIFG